MSAAASQADKFYEQVVADGFVYTFLDTGSFLVFPVRDIEVVPFWSSRSRLRLVQRHHPKYRAYAEDELTLDDFLSKTLPGLERESIHVGVNWSGKRLVGFDISVDQLRRNLSHRQVRSKTSKAV